jgi:SAM-dependent methyltransferase
LNRLKNRIKDRVRRRFARDDDPHTEPYRHICEELPHLSIQERDALYRKLKRQLAGNTETTAYAEAVFTLYFNYYRQHIPSVQGIRILEIGPGNNLGAGIYFLLAGARHYVGFDVLATFPDRPQEYYRELLEEVSSRPQLVGRALLSKEEQDDIVKMEHGLQWNPERIEYLTPAYAEQMPFRDDHFDYVYSNASFEHFQEPARVVHEVHRVLKPGGYTAHTIDLRDHADFSKPRQFLQIAPEIYRFASPHETNRWRASDFERAFRSAGFRTCEVLINEASEIKDEEFEKLDSHFRTNFSREDLAILGITVLAAK